MAKTRKLPTVDLDRLMSGCLECFVDPAPIPTGALSLPRAPLRRRSSAGNSIQLPIVQHRDYSNETLHV
jgi:hypothetical protein